MKSLQLVSLAEGESDPSKNRGQRFRFVVFAWEKEEFVDAVKRQLVYLKILQRWINWLKRNWWWVFYAGCGFGCLTLAFWIDGFFL
jgi:hypothetical protein